MKNPSAKAENALSTHNFRAKSIQIVEINGDGGGVVFRSFRVQVTMYFMAQKPFLFQSYVCCDNVEIVTMFQSFCKMVTMFFSYWEKAKRRWFLA